MEEMTINVSKLEVVADGGKYRYGDTTGNKGEMIEAFIRKALQPNNNTWYKKDSVPYDLGSDIELSPEEKISVKSGNSFSITEKITTSEYTESNKALLIETYKKTVHSNIVMYANMTETDSEYIIHIIAMPMAVFIKVLEKIGTLTATDSSKTKYKLRVKKSVNTIIRTITALNVGI